jgi:hypothetical protein
VSTVSHQTIKLSKGKHASPEHGACVMELASMLAGERFTDHPRSVSRPIAAFLRGYNDLLDDPRRQDLYRYASRCVGTASSPLLERARVRRLLEWGDEQWDHSAGASWLERMRRLRARRSRSTDPETAATYALRGLAHARPSHRLVLALVDELIEMGAQAAGRRASSSRLWASSESARRSSLRTASWESPSLRPVSLSGVGSSPPTP